MKPIEWGILAVPAVICFTASAICPIGKSAGQSVSFRPPAWVFGLVWTKLFLAIGYSAVLTRRNYKSELPMLAYGILVGLLCAWIITYGCCKNKRVSVWILLKTLTMAIVCLVIARDLVARLLLVPLITWVAFALLMNAVEVQLH